MLRLFACVCGWVGRWHWHVYASQLTPSSSPTRSRPYNPNQNQTGGVRAAGEQVGDGRAAHLRRTPVRFVCTCLCRCMPLLCVGFECMSHTCMDDLTAPHHTTSPHTTLKQGRLRQQAAGQGWGEAHGRGDRGLHGQGACIYICCVTSPPHTRAHHRHKTPDRPPTTTTHRP